MNNFDFIFIFSCLNTVFVEFMFYYVCTRFISILFYLIWTLLFLLDLIQNKYFCKQLAFVSFFFIK